MRGVVGTGCSEDHLPGGRGVKGGVGKRRKTKQDCKLGDMAAVSLLGLSKKILLLSPRETLSFSNRWLITFICLLRSASIRTYLTVCIKSQILNKDK